MGKAFDCRLGCSGVLEVLRGLSDDSLHVDVVGAFSTQEEVGLRGAKITSQRVKPALAICLEGTPADDTFMSKDEAQGALKKGVQIRFRDGSMVAHPGFVAFAKKVAEECGHLPTNALSEPAAARTAVQSTCRIMGFRRWFSAFPFVMRTRITVMPPQQTWMRQSNLQKR